MIYTPPSKLNSRLIIAALMRFVTILELDLLPSTRVESAVVSASPADQSIQINRAPENHRAYEGEPVALELRPESDSDSPVVRIGNYYSPSRFNSSLFEPKWLQVDSEAKRASTAKPVTKWSFPFGGQQLSSSFMPSNGTMHNPLYFDDDPDEKLRGRNEISLQVPTEPLKLTDKDPAVESPLGGWRRSSTDSDTSSASKQQPSSIQQAQKALADNLALQDKLSELLERVRSREVATKASWNELAQPPKSSQELLPVGEPAMQTQTAGQLMNSAIVATTKAGLGRPPRRRFIRFPTGPSTRSRQAGAVMQIAASPVSPPKSHQTDATAALVSGAKHSTRPGKYLTDESSKTRVDDLGALIALEGASTEVSSASTEPSLSHYSDAADLWHPADEQSDFWQQEPRELPEASAWYSQPAGFKGNLGISADRPRRRRLRYQGQPAAGREALETMHYRRPADFDRSRYGYGFEGKTKHLFESSPDYNPAMDLSDGDNLNLHLSHKNQNDNENFHANSNYRGHHQRHHNNHYHNDDSVHHLQQHQPMASASSSYNNRYGLNDFEDLVSDSPSHQVVHIHGGSKSKGHGKYLWPILGGGLTMLMGFLIISNMLLSIPLLAIGASSLFNQGSFHSQQLVPVYNLSQLTTRAPSGRRRRRRWVIESVDLASGLKLPANRLKSNPPAHQNQHQIDTRQQQQQQQIHKQLLEAKLERLIDSMVESARQGSPRLFGLSRKQVLKAAYCRHAIKIKQQ